MENKDISELKKELSQVMYDEKMATMAKDEAKLELLRKKHALIHQKLVELTYKNTATASLQERGR